MYHVAVIGHGYWGRNIARVFNSSPDFSLKCVCDCSPPALAEARALYPAAVAVPNIDEIPADINVVAVITPVGERLSIAERFLNAGKHVLVTKPSTLRAIETDSLIALAERKGVAFFVDNTFVFNPAVIALKNILPKIGKPYFTVSQRMNLGRFQSDMNVIFDLMPHDVAILSYLFEANVTQANTTAVHSAGLPQEDLAHSTFLLDNNVHGLVTVSWLAPMKVRKLFVVGQDGMLTYDDVAVSEKVCFYDKGLRVDADTPPDPANLYTARISYRAGDMYSPAIANREALEIEMGEFAQAIRDEKVRRSYNKLNSLIMRNLEKLALARRL